MILVTGAGGMVGCHLRDQFADDELIRTDLIGSADERPLDIRDRAQVMKMIGETGPRLVLHMGAETDVDRCEREVDHAYTSNLVGTLNVALACQEYDIDLVYVSTCAVFDGGNPEPYTEFDTPNPLTVYAKSKLEGEKVVTSLLKRYYIVRAGWMFGGRARDKKFVGRIAQLCQTEKEIRAVNDKVGNPTYASDLLKTVRVLTDRKLYGLYHVVNAGTCSRYDVAVEVARFLGSSVKIKPVSSALFPASAPRSRSEAARAYKLELLGIHTMRDWRSALSDYLESWMLPPEPAAAPEQATAGARP
jgi:dTDP-4-dehydrorhamnose reductase